MEKVFGQLAAFDRYDSWFADSVRAMHHDFARRSESDGDELLAAVESHDDDTPSLRYLPHFFHRKNQ
jgi:hypothetical protein